MVGPHKISVRASVGRALFPHDGDASEDLLRRADVSMFEMKRGAVAQRD
jgi:predicted signal transduction protein with EAL and GGDEF domain